MGISNHSLELLKTLTQLNGISGHESEVRNYLKETYRILKRGGMALFHHSNNNRDYKATFLSGECGRNYMSMGMFAHFADRAGLSVVEQVEFPWNDQVTDGITLLRKE